MVSVKKELFLPDGYTKDDAQTIAEELLSYIVTRSKQGKGMDGSKFAPYSSAYKRSLDFKIAGKSSLVNLTLSGEMLDSLEVVSANSKKIVIGYANDTDKALLGKVEGNITGSYGSTKANPSKARNFLEISDKELTKVMKSLTGLDRSVQNQITKDAKAGAIDIVDNFKFSVGYDNGDNTN